MQSVPAGQRLGGVPAIDLKAWRRQVALLGRLDEVLRRLRAIERRVGIAAGSDDEPAAGGDDDTAGETT
jgi:hypothetical protein